MVINLAEGYHSEKISLVDSEKSISGKKQNNLTSTKAGCSLTMHSKAYRLFFVLVQRYQREGMGHASIVLRSKLSF